MNNFTSLLRTPSCHSRHRGPPHPALPAWMLPCPKAPVAAPQKPESAGAAGPRRFLRASGPEDPHLAGSSQAPESALYHLSLPLRFLSQSSLPSQPHSLPAMLHPRHNPHPNLTFPKADLHPGYLEESFSSSALIHPILALKRLCVSGFPEEGAPDYEQPPASCKGPCLFPLLLLRG